MAARDDRADAGSGQALDPHGRILLNLVGRHVAQEVDRLWPQQTISERGQALAEEAGEVNRAILKRGHLRKYGWGYFKGLDEQGWTDNLRLELAQLIGVALDIAAREGFDIAEDVIGVLSALQNMDPPHAAASKGSSHA